MSTLSILERAKRFARAIDARWATEVETDADMIIFLEKESGAYRALLKKEIGRMVKTSSDFHPLRRKGFIEGLEAALELFDVIHGRKEK